MENRVSESYPNVTAMSNPQEEHRWTVWAMGTRTTHFRILPLRGKGKLERRQAFFKLACSLLHKGAKLTCISRKRPRQDSNHLLTKGGSIDNSLSSTHKGSRTTEAVAPVLPACSTVMICAPFVFQVWRCPSALATTSQTFYDTGWRCQFSMKGPSRIAVFPLFVVGHCV